MKKWTTIWNLFVMIGAILFLSGSFVQAGETEDKEYQEWLKEKKMRQERKMEPIQKSPWLGSLMAAVVPTTGHFYANDQWRSIKYMPTELGGAALIIYAATNRNKVDDPGLYYGIGWPLFIISKIWEMSDAFGAVKDYNLWHFDAQKKEIDQRIAYGAERYGHSGYKSPNWAFLSSLIIPTMGQSYANAWDDQAALILGGELGGLLLIGIGIGRFTSSNGWFNFSGLTEIGLGLMLFGTFKIWDVMDAHNDATNYNHNLYKRYKAKMNKTNVGLYMPNTNTFGLQLSYYF